MGLMEISKLYYIFKLGGEIMRRIIMWLLLALVWVGLAVDVARAESAVTAHFFYGKGCPHCAKEMDFLDRLEDKYPQLVVEKYEIYYDLNNNILLQKVGAYLRADVGGVPFLVIGDKYYIGYAEGIIAEEIEARVRGCVEVGCEDIVAVVLDEPKNPVPKPSVSPTVVGMTGSQPAVGSKIIGVPIFGEIETNKLSLPVLTFILALLDGFNPCAMWTLLFLISLLLGMKDRKRMWMLGMVFIAASALVYFLFLSAWLNLFLFLGFVVWVRILIGVVAIGVGGYYLRDCWINREGGCGVMGDERRQKIFERLRAITQKQQLFLALGGMIMLAVAVNMVELICSAGLPAIYTQILSLSNLANWQYYLYLCFYILIFMMDDLFVFITAMVTLRAVGVQSKYSRYSHLLGGCLMLVIGLLLLFKPEWLMFG